MIYDRKIFSNLIFLLIIKKYSNYSLEIRKSFGCGVIHHPTRALTSTWIPRPAPPFRSAMRIAVALALGFVTAAHGFLGHHHNLLTKRVRTPAARGLALEALPSDLKGTISLEIHDDDAFAVVTATNYALGYQDFTAEIVSKDGAAYDGIEVFPAEGAFGPKNSVPSKEKIPNTDRLMRPYGATVPFKLAWKKTAPQLNIQSTGAPLGPQRVWSNSSTANFPDDAYLLVKSEEEDMAWKVDFTA